MGRADRFRDHTDEQLVAAIHAGQVDAFDALYERHRDWVVRLAFRFTRDDDAALDVLQEAFAYVAGKFPGFELRARMTTFLYPVVKNLALRWREKHLRLDVKAPDDLAAMAPVEMPAHDVEQANALDAVLARLSDTHREIVLMRFVDDMSLSEIALALEVPDGTVKSRLHHALKALRDDPRTRPLLAP